MAAQNTEQIFKAGESLAEGIFRGILNSATGGISTFVAFLFALFTAGAVYGYWVTTKGSSGGFLLIVAPAVFGLLTYKYRNLGLGLFVVMIIWAMVGV